MYSITIRDHIMIAHSLGESFGPAAQLHGATYVADVSFFSETLTHQQVVIDIDVAAKALSKCLDLLRYKNLDELPEFKNQITTTEFLAKYIHQLVKSEIKEQFTGKIRVTLGESHVAWASFEE